MGFYGSNDPTNSVKALKEGPKDWASIPPGPPHRVTIIQHMQYDKIIRKTNINTNEFRHSEMVPVRQNPSREL